MAKPISQREKVLPPRDDRQARQAFEARRKLIPGMQADGTADMLPHEVKLYIVEMMACFRAPTQVAKTVKEVFNIDITRQQAEYYDPTKACGRRLGKVLRAHFDAAREQYLQAVSMCGVADQRVRLAALDRAFVKMEEAGNVKGTLMVLEQAAKEVGGMFTNARVISGPVGGPVEVSMMSSEEREARVRELLAKGAGRVRGVETSVGVAQGSD